MQDQAFVCERRSIRRDRPRLPRGDPDGARGGLHVRPAQGLIIKRHERLLGHEFSAQG